MTYQKDQIIRKLIHVSIGLIIWILSYILETNNLLFLILSGTIFSFLTFNYERFQFLHKTVNSSLGTLSYQSGKFLSYLILYDLPVDRLADIWKIASLYFSDVIFFIPQQHLSILHMLRKNSKHRPFPF